MEASILRDALERGQEETYYSYPDDVLESIAKIWNEIIFIKLKRMNAEWGIDIELFEKHSIIAPQDVPRMLAMLELANTAYRANTAKLERTANFLESIQRLTREFPSIPG